jgi:8-oxo-dGTP diphosphatase
VACAGGIVFDDARRLLVIRRGTPPASGLWSIPGGRCEPGEPPAAACVREVAEETGLYVQVERHAGRVERDGPGGVVYEIDDFVCSVLGGALRAGDDAADARWVTAAELGSLDLVPGLLDALTTWRLIPY